MLNTDTIFFQNIFHLWLTKYVDADPLNMEGQL